ncbi:bacteriocin biosynthesis cyclodehydratase domain-containing protein [Mycetocola sp. 2940]
MISGMFLQLDPRYPIVWRDTSSLQIGAEHPLARLDRVTPALEHLLGAVMAGTSRNQLDNLATQVGAEPDDVDRFLAEITPALLAPERLRETPHWIVDGDGKTADGIRRLLRSSGFPESGTETAEPPDLAVLVSTHVIDPRRYVRWLSLDIPHLAVVYTDIGVQIGPLVEPGAGPCLHCLARERTDADAAWPVMAAQLLGRPSLAEQEPLISEVSARVARIVTARLENGSNDLVSASLRIDAFRVSGSLTVHRPHPECGCRSLSGSATAPAAGESALNAQPTT